MALEFPLRPFQQEVLELVRERNVVLVGDTGIGKTHVAIALLNEQDYSSSRRAVFLAPTRQLVLQITAKIRSMSTLPVGMYCGREMDLWDQQRWDREMRLHRVLVCTPQVACNAIQKGYIQLSKLNLLVFDECHHVTKRHPYAQLMRHYKSDSKSEAGPRIFGATSCPTRHCADHLHAQIKKITLSDNERARFAAAAPILYETYEAAVMAKEEDNGETDTELDELEDTLLVSKEQVAGMQPMVKELRAAKVLPVYEKLLKKDRRTKNLEEAALRKKIQRFFGQCVTVYQNLGLWCLLRLMEIQIEHRALQASLLMTVPGSLYGLDRDAIKTIMILRQRQAACGFSCTPKLQKIVDLVRIRLFSDDESEVNGMANSEDSAKHDDEASSDVSSETSGESDSESKGEEDETLRSLQGIIFLKTRAECRLVSDYLNEVWQQYDDGKKSEDSFEDAIEQGGGHAESSKSLFSCIVGQASKSDVASFNLPKFSDTLHQFERGEIRVLVSTSVSAEGVDFPLCGLVIISDTVDSARKLIQLQGRARHSDGIVYFLAEEGDMQHAIRFKELSLEIQRINALDFSLDKVESVLHKPITEAVQSMPGYAFFPDESVIEFASSGARLDLDHSISCFNMFCQSIPKALGEVDLKELYSFTQETLHKRPFFRCRLDLPAFMEIDAIESKLMHSKAIAKASVAFDACRILLEKGLLDECLNSVYRKGKGKVAIDGDSLQYFLRRIQSQ